MEVQLPTLERWDVVQRATSDPMIFDGDGGVHGPTSNKQAVNQPQPLPVHRGPIQRHMTAAPRSTRTWSTTCTTEPITFAVKFHCNFHTLYHFLVVCRSDSSLHCVVLSPRLCILLIWYLLFFFENRPRPATGSMRPRRDMEKPAPLP